MLKIPSEAQIRSWITQIRKLDNIEEEDLIFPKRDEIWELASLCYKVRMAQLGLEGVYESIMKEYEKKKHYNYEHTLLKVLYRCSLAYRSKERIKKIFKMMKLSQKVKVAFEKESAKLITRKVKESTQ